MSYLRFSSQNCVCVEVSLRTACCCHNAIYWASIPYLLGHSFCYFVFLYFLTFSKLKINKSNNYHSVYFNLLSLQMRHNVKQDLQIPLVCNSSKIEKLSTPWWTAQCGWCSGRSSLPTAWLEQLFQVEHARYSLSSFPVFVGCPRCYSSCIRFHLKLAKSWICWTKWECLFCWHLMQDRSWKQPLFSQCRCSLFLPEIKWRLFNLKVM